MWPEPLERGLAGDAEGDADGCPGVAGGAGSIHCGPQLRFGCLDRFFRGDDARRWLASWASAGLGSIVSSHSSMSVLCFTLISSPQVVVELRA